jgi:hypothetical protein
VKQTVLLDPTNEAAPVRRQAAPALASLDGQCVALVDIAKPRGAVFLDRLEELLAQRGIQVARFRKPTHAKVAPPDLRRRIAERCRAAVVALAD